MTARLIDGKAVALVLRERLARIVAGLRTDHDLQPGLAVVLVGEDPASQVYVRNKARQTAECGMRSFEHRLPADTSQADLLALVARLNADPAVNGILVQLPLPGQIAEAAVIEAIAPEKDVDGFHPVNVGRVASGSPSGIVPCTPMGSMLLIAEAVPDPAGLHAVVIGRSNIVGKPMAQLLLARHCSVSVVHSRTREIERITRQADILVAAVGRPEMVRGHWIKPGACVVDVGINRVGRADDGAVAGGTRLVGDVAFEEALQVAGAITPVPGGVGPMTIACLLRNTVQAACRQRGLPLPAGL
jgi:methylenetetrahydrofolate dehydrogenase (NADP+)/methenyltetrahydrofolate cyclohydrolase